MKEIDIVIDNPTGLHARPAKYFVKIAKQFTSDIHVQKDDKKANAKSMVSMLTLGVKCGMQIHITVEGSDEEEALKAITEAIESGLGESGHEPAASSQLAEAPAHQKQQRPQEQDVNVIQGLAAAPGCVIGPVWHMVRSEIKIQETFAGASAEQARLQEAIEKARGQLIVLRQKMQKHSANEADIFNVHLELLEDTELLEEVIQKIEKGENAPRAWQSTVDAHAKVMSELDDPLLAARGADLHDVSYRVLRLMVGEEEQTLGMQAHPVIVIANDLSPSETAALDKSKVLGFCTAAGGPTAHSAIIARAMGIPAVVSAGERVLRIPAETVAILDGGKGTLTPNPTESAVSEAEKAAEEFRRLRQENMKAAGEPAVTKDGHRIEVVANIGGLKDAKKVIESGAEGVGLFRTEFLFLGQEKAPTEDEQFKVYKEIVLAMQGHPIIIRTLDIGGDKPLPYIHVPPEENPFLGERGIRLCLNRPELLRQQLRAIFRAAVFGPVRIMFPMVSDLSDWHRISAEVDGIKKELSNVKVELGVMIEVPSAALTAAALAPYVDFFSIGTNDLTQYTLAIDRMHPTLSGRLDGLHPAVLRLIEFTVKAAEKYGKWVGVCGELAADMQAVPIFIGLGVAELSVGVPSVPDVKARVRSLNLSESRSLAARALECALASEVRTLQGSG